MMIPFTQIFVWGCLNNRGSETNISEESIYAINEYIAEEGMVIINGGPFVSIVDRVADSVFIKPFIIDKHEVSIAEFEIFVTETGYVPQSDRSDSEAFVLVARKIQSVKGVNWRYDERGIERVEKNYPVVYVSYEDAEAYAKWAGKRLPTLYEWMFVAISETDEQTRWNYILNNSWHTNNTSSLKISGLKAPNKFGVYDIFGNVGEHVQAGREEFNSLPPGLNLEDASRAAYSSFFNDPEDLVMPLFSIGHKKGVNFYTGFRCAKDLEIEKP